MSAEMVQTTQMMPVDPDWMLAAHHDLRRREVKEEEVEYYNDDHSPHDHDH